MSLQILQKFKIYHIVNCKGPEDENYFEKDNNFKYFRFNISNWHSLIKNKSDEGILNFFKPCHNFID
jgi:hypothetical protein